MTGRTDFEMNEGESKKIVASQTDDEDNGGDKNIQGRQSLVWQLKYERGGKVIVEKTESGSNDVTVTDSSIGAYEILIDPSDTEGVLLKNEDTLYHKVRLTDGSGDKTDLMEGYITVTEA